MSTWHAPCGCSSAWSACRAGAHPRLQSGAVPDSGLQLPPHGHRHLRAHPDCPGLRHPRHPRGLRRGGARGARVLQGDRARVAIPAGDQGSGVRLAPSPAHPHSPAQTPLPLHTYTPGHTHNTARPPAQRKATCPQNTMDCDHSLGWRLSADTGYIPDRRRAFRSTTSRTRPRLMISDLSSRSTAQLATSSSHSKCSWGGWIDKRRTPSANVSSHPSPALWQRPRRARSNVLSIRQGL